MLIELKHVFCLKILFGQVIELRGRNIGGRGGYENLGAITKLKILKVLEEQVLAHRGLHDVVHVICVEKTT